MLFPWRLEIRALVEMVCLILHYVGAISSEFVFNFFDQNLIDHCVVDGDILRISGKLRTIVYSRSI